MVLTARLTPSSSALSGGPQSRMPAGARGVATVHGGPIEEMSAWGGVRGDQATDEFLRFGQHSDGRGESRSPVPDAYKTPLQATQSFTSLIEQFSEVNTRFGTNLTVGSIAVAVILPRAIDAYEKTAIVISGNQDNITGGVFSATL